jgi:hypothetical protein
MVIGDWDFVGHWALVISSSNKKPPAIAKRNDRGFMKTLAVTYFPAEAVSSAHEA